MILQFGTGRFLRGFFASVIPEPSSIVVVQSRAESEGAARINASRREYHVWTRGIDAGQIIDRYETVRSIDRALVAATDWDELLEIARDARLRLVVSNTTEAGLQLDPRDNDASATVPHSYPARLLSLLRERFNTGLPGVTVLPMELVEYNARVLMDLVIRQSELWWGDRHGEFVTWLQNENRWLSNLVDRIVVGVTETPPWPEDDPLAVVAEPWRHLAILDDGLDRSIVPQHEMVEWVTNLEPCFLRKVRVLNGLHTAMVARCLPRGFQTVLEVMQDKRERNWLEQVLAEEILPVLDSREIDARPFARSVLERFENPFFKHQLSDIAKGHEKKLETRIAPTVREFENEFGKPPKELTGLLSP